MRHVLRDGNRAAGSAHRGAGDLAQLSRFLKEDGIVIPRIQAVGVTGGKAALTAILYGGVSSSYARMDLSVIEAEHGRVECYIAGVQHATLKQLTEKPGDVMKKASRVTLKKYPEADKVWDVKEEELVAEKEEEGEEDAAIEDFEALLGQDEEKPAEGDQPPEGEKPPEREKAAGPPRPVGASYFSVTRPTGQVTPVPPSPQ